MKLRIFKYGTGDPVPNGAKFLSTVVQEIKTQAGPNTEMVERLVWHYFLIEVPE